MLNRMCYLVYLSTTSQEDLSKLPSKLYHFYSYADEDSPNITNLLNYSKRWYLECQYGGCSCHFRHLGSGSDMNFGPPEDWCPEDTDNIEATKAVYDVLTSLMETGNKVDLVDIWNNAQAETITAIDVNMAEVDRSSFRFFENYRFNLTM